MKPQRGEWDDDDDEDEVDASDDEEEEEGVSGSDDEGDGEDGGLEGATRRLLGAEEAAALTDGFLAGGRSYEARALLAQQRAKQRSSRRACTGGCAAAQRARVAPAPHSRAQRVSSTTAHQFTPASLPECAWRAR
jgi:hypothetical protein